MNGTDSFLNIGAFKKLTEKLDNNTDIENISKSGIAKLVTDLRVYSNIKWLNMYSN
jgi:hypothetical protein